MACPFYQCLEKALCILELCFLSDYQNSILDHRFLHSTMDDSPQSTASSMPYESTVTYTMSIADDIKTQHRQLFNPVTPDISPPPQVANGGFSMKSKEAPVRRSSISNTFFPTSYWRHVLAIPHCHPQRLQSFWSPQKNHDLWLVLSFFELGLSTNQI